MMCAIFFLLAFCAFKTVFGDKLQKDLENLCKASTEEIFAIFDRLRTPINADFAAARKEGTTPECEENCWTWNHYAEFRDTHLQPKLDLCTQCHDDAAINRDIKLARRCCLNSITALKSQAKSTRASVKTCLAKCVQEMQVTTVKKVKGCQGRPRRGVIRYSCNCCDGY